MKKSSVQRTPVRKRVRWLLGLPLLLLLGAALWIMVGVPGTWVTRWINPRLPHGFLVEASEVRYTPGKGFRISEFEIYSPEDLVTPLAKAGEFTLIPHFFKIIREKEWSADLKIRHGELETNLGTWADDLKTDQLLHIQSINGELRFSPDGWVFEEIRGSLPNMDIRLNGKLDFGVGDGLASPSRIPRTARIVSEVLVFMENFHFDSAPLIEVDFSSAADPKNFPRIDLTLAHLGPSKHRGFAFEEMKLGATYQHRVLTVHSFLVRENEKREIRGKARVDFAENIYEVEIENTLRRFGLEALSPFSLGNLLDWLQLRIEDRCDFRIKVGPNTFKNPAYTVSGEFQVENGFYRDGFFPEISLVLDLDYPHLKMTDIKGVLGQGKGKGPFSGEIELDFKSGLRRLEVDGAFYPDFAVSMVGNLAEKYLREWEFRGPPPVFSARFDLKETGAPILLEVDAKGQDLLWRGTAFDYAASKVEFRDQKLSIREAQAGRGKERVEAELLFTPGFKGCHFDLKSNFHLPDVLQLIGPQVAKTVQSFRFRGASEIEAEGFWDLSANAGHDIRAAYAFGDLVWNWLSVNQLQGSLKLEDQVLELPDIQAELEGGALNANLRAQNLFAENGHFALTLQLKNMDLYKVITKATDLEDTPYRGELSLDLNLKGAIKDSEERPRSETYTGGGRLEIKEGSLFKIPLLLGLSEILSKIVSGFGYASQSDFSADFDIKDGFIRTKELFLQGNVLSIAGPGSFRFEDRKISADLKIHLLKDGILSDALKLILWPIRKLVEVQLTGTLDQPDWQPKNLPKEIFGK